MYGLNPGAASRTTTDAQTKQQQISVRPDYMTKQVEQWQDNVARNEKMCAYFSGVNGESVQPLVGDVGAMIFDQTFANADPDTVLREMNCSITAGSAKKPNRQQDAANLKEIYQPLSIQLTQAWQATGDPGPINNLNRKMGHAMEVDMDGLDIGPAPPPPEEQPPPPDPAQEAQAEHTRQDMELQAARQTQQMQISGAQHQQDVQQQAESHQADMMMKLAKMRLDRMNAGHKMAMEKVKAKAKPTKQPARKAG
jgi:hypothetical protein